MSNYKRGDRPEGTSRPRRKQRVAFKAGKLKQSEGEPSRAAARRTSGRPAGRGYEASRLVPSPSRQSK